MVANARTVASRSATTDWGSGRRAAETIARKMKRIPQSGRSAIVSAEAIAAPATSHGTRCGHVTQSHGPTSALP